MPINLSSYRNIESALFVQLSVDYYKQNPGDTPIGKTFFFSDALYPLTLLGQSYVGLGRFMAITSTTSELKASSQELTITIGGIPNTSLYEIINSKFKGSRISVWRGVYDTSTRQFLNITGNPVGRFFGIVNNFTLTEEYDNQTKNATNTIGLICTSIINVLDNTKGGRRTNPKDQEYFYPGDLSMDRVPALVGASFDFGAPQ